MPFAPDVHTAIDLARTGARNETRCPTERHAHGDRRPSLSVGPGFEQDVVLSCHVGCDTADILAAAGLDWSAICSERDRARQQPEVRYHYRDEQGAELFQVVRTPPKRFWQGHYDADGRWINNMRDVRRVLYRLPEVIKAVAEGEEVWVAEGEKDVETLVAHGVCATTNPMGANKDGKKWRTEYTETLRAARVTIVADKDEDGRGHATAILAALRAADADVRIVEAAHGKDAADHFAGGGNLATFVETTPRAQTAQLPEEMDVHDLIRLVDEPEQFVIDGLMARDERLLLTGFEGHGKSELLRQIAVTVAGGMHPFTLESQPRRRVVYVDAENPARQSRWSFASQLRLANRHGHPVEREWLIVVEAYRQEPDLLTPFWGEWLMSLVYKYRPDLLCLGPIQNLSGRDVKDDEVVRKIKRVVNEARYVCGSAVIMEHHCPLRHPTDKVRNTRPYGSSLFLKWPDYGYGLAPTDDPDLYEFAANRKPRVRSRSWPTHLRKGTPDSYEFPWVPHEDVAGSVDIKRQLHSV